MGSKQEELIDQMREVATEKGLGDIVGYLDGISTKSDAELAEDQARFDEWLSDPANKERWENALENAARTPEGGSR